MAESPISQKRKLSESSDGLNIANKKPATEEDCPDDESVDCQIINDTIPLIVLDSDLEECGASGVIEVTSTTDVEESDGKDEEWVWVERTDVPQDTGSGQDGLKVEHTKALTEPEQVTQESTEPIIQLCFRDKNTFMELKNMLHQTIRETLFRHKRIVKIDENSDELQLLISDAIEDDSCVFMVDANPAVISPDDSTKKSTADKCVPQYSLNVSKVFDHSTPTVPLPKDDQKCEHVRQPKNTCFNCNGNHTIRECPEPKNQQMIQKNRSKFQPFRHQERYHIDANQQFGHFLPGVLSQTLRQALGLRDQELPLYVYRMRMLGYPPGWLEDAKVTQSGMELFDDREISDPANADNEEQFYDLKKIISYPGFNVDPEPGVYDMSYNLRMPQMQPHQGRDVMLQTLRSKTRQKPKFVVPVANLQARVVDLNSQQMDLEDGEEPPIPEADPPPPGVSSAESPASPTPNIPDNPASPSLDDLREQQIRLLAALNSSATTSMADDSLIAPPVDDSLIDDILALETTANDDTIASSICESPEPNDKTNPLDDPSTPPSNNQQPSNAFATPVTPLNSSIQTVSGTPLIQSVSPYETIPVGANWSVGVSDIIDFENLEGSVGKYEKMKGLIKRIRVKVKDLNDEYEQ